MDVANYGNATYYLDGDKVIYEETGDNLLFYTYDEAGQLIGLNHNNQQYYYIRNAQGDIIGILDEDLEQIIVSYTYDTICIESGMGSHETCPDCKFDF